MIFKEGDKVYDYAYGWGEVECIFNDRFTHPIQINFKGNKQTYCADGSFISKAKPTLSFTEYKLEGFSQERPKERPKEPLPFKAGDVVYLSDSQDVWISCILGQIESDYPFYGEHVGNYSKLALDNPLKNPDTKIYTKEDL